jgi:hypothetical protein
METMDQSEKKRYQAVSIGNIAHESLATEQEGSVMGITSRGIFIKTADKWLKFLSYEDYRGPLTINLPFSEASLLPIDQGTKVLTSLNMIIIPEASVEISIQDSEVWQPQSFSVPAMPRDERRSRLISVAKRIPEGKKDAGLAPLLPRLLNIADQVDTRHPEYTTLGRNILQLQGEVKSAPGIPPLNSVIKLLGSGAGLTPSGDDFVIGLLLAFNRWKEAFFDLPDLEDFNQQIVDAAYHKTTTLSANLIECAARGLGNERLIETLDWLVGGHDREPGISDGLLSWGNSSGIDVLAGYVVALLV